MAWRSHFGFRHGASSRFARRRVVARTLEGGCSRMHILTGVRELGLAVLETAVRRRPDLEGRIRAYV